MKEEELISRLEEIRKKIKNKEYPMLSIDSLIRQIQIDKEEPVTIWHDAIERPQKIGDRVAWVDKRFGVMNTGWYNKDAFDHEDLRDPICKFSFDEISKWAYVDDLLSLTNQVTKMSEQEKAVSDDIEEEITNEVNRYTEYCEKRLSEMADDDTDISFMDLRSYAKHFVNWQNKMMMKGAMDAKICAIIIHENADELHFSIQYPVGKAPFKIHDKVKVVVIKED